MSDFTQRLSLTQSQRQILTPGLMQMVAVLQLNRLELREMIQNEVDENPVLEEAGEAGEDLTPAELQAMLELDARHDPADAALLEKIDQSDAEAYADPPPAEGAFEQVSSAATTAVEEPVKTETDPFEEIDFGSFFDDYLDPGFKSPASESIEKPSFETFLSYPVRLSDHLQSQLSVEILPERIRQAANGIIGNLEETGYLETPLEEIAAAEGLTLAEVQAGLKAVQSLEPTGVGAQNLRECLLLQLEARDAKDSVAWQIVHDHLRTETPRQLTQLAKALGRPLEHVQIALNVIRHLDPAPGSALFRSACAKSRARCLHLQRR